MDAVEQNLRALGIRGWKNIALDRRRWQGIVKAVKAWWYHRRRRRRRRSLTDTTREIMIRIPSFD
jgi:hypothetical protein